MFLGVMRGIHRIMISRHQRRIKGKEQGQSQKLGVEEVSLER